MADGSPFDAELEVRERTGGVSRLAGAGALVALLCSYLAQGSAPLAIALLAIGVLGIVGFRDALTSRTSRLRVRVTDEGLVLSHLLSARYGPRLETRTFSRAEIGSGHFVPAGRGGRVVLRVAGGRELLELQVEDEEQGARLLAALGLDASKQRFTRDVASPLGALVGPIGNRIVAALTLLSLGTASLYAGFSPVYAIATFAIVTLALIWPKRVEIATDGVAVTWIGRRRFVSFADVLDLQVDRHRVTLRLAGGEELVVSRDDSAGVVGARLREALDAYRHAKGDSVVAALVSRDERSAAEWLAHLRGLRAEGYRAAPLEDEALLRVIEDPGASPDARAGAVVLLREKLDASGRQRVRVASEATAEPHLRVALDALAEAEGDDEIEEHLERLRGAAAGRGSRKRRQ